MRAGRQLLIKYYVEPDAALLARRAAQYFAEMAGEAVASQDRARIAISGGSTPRPPLSCWPTATSPGIHACPGNTSISTGWTNAACRPEIPRATIV